MTLPDLFKLLLGGLFGVASVAVPALFQLNKWRAQARLADATARAATVNAEQNKETVEAKATAMLMGAAGKLVQDTLADREQNRLERLAQGVTIDELKDSIEKLSERHQLDLVQMETRHRQAMDALKTDYDKRVAEERSMHAQEMDVLNRQYESLFRRYTEQGAENEKLKKRVADLEEQVKRVPELEAQVRRLEAATNGS